MNLLVDSVERICDYRWDTWVCIKLRCGLEYNEEQEKQIEKEILDIVNNCDSDLFYNKHMGEKKYKYAIYKCECGHNQNEKEHWILSNSEFDRE